jgi:hypothetical protein
VALRHSSSTLGWWLPDPRVVALGLFVHTDVSLSMCVACLIIMIAFVLTVAQGRLLVLVLGVATHWFPKLGALRRFDSIRFGDGWNRKPAVWSMVVSTCVTLKITSISCLGKQYKCRLFPRIQRIVVNK